MAVSNVHLSASELQLFCNADFILTKNRIIDTAIHLLQQVQDQMVAHSTSHPLFTVSPKITKGENYLGLPYIILDYPRIADKKGICFIRSMFWWGNFYSSTLHLNGGYVHDISENLLSQFATLKEKEYAISINQDQWVHHFQTENYKPLKVMDEPEYRYLIQERAFIKLAAKWPLMEMQSAEERLMESWEFLVQLITKAVK